MLSVGWGQGAAGYRARTHGYGGGAAYNLRGGVRGTRAGRPSGGSWREGRLGPITQADHNGMTNGH